MWKKNEKTPKMILRGCTLSKYFHLEPINFLLLLFIKVK